MNAYWNVLKAVATTSQTPVKSAANSGNTGTGTGTSSGIGPTVTPVGDGSNTLTTNVASIINAVIGVLGLVAVVIIIIGGVNYMTSAGDAGKVKTAKNTILYGVIGLVICVLAFAIVNFVISNVLKNV